jgi:hypothetical protein
VSSSHDDARPSEGRSSAAALVRARPPVARARRLHRPSAGRSRERAEWGRDDPPPRFFTATVVAFPPSSPPQGRYTLGALALLDPSAPTGTYATALLQPDTKGLRLTLRADGLGTPAPSAVSYELVTASGVFHPLADGEWDRATAQGGGWTATGTLIFVIPRDLRAGRLDVVDYYYPQAHPETGPTPEPLAALVRRTLATFALDRLP